MDNPRESATCLEATGGSPLLAPAMVIQQPPHQPSPPDWAMHGLHSLFGGDAFLHQELSGGKIFVEDLKGTAYDVPLGMHPGAPVGL